MIKIIMDLKDVRGHSGSIPTPEPNSSVSIHTVTVTHTLRSTQASRQQDAPSFQELPPPPYFPAAML